MMGQKVKVWFDPEADCLEVQFCEAPGILTAPTVPRIPMAAASELKVADPAVGRRKKQATPLR